MRSIYVSTLLLISIHLLSSPLYALGPGDEVIVSEGRKDINVRSETIVSGELLYQVSAGEKGVILKGPMDKNGHRWYLIDWDDDDIPKPSGWTAMVDNWYTPTGKNLVSKIELLHTYSETFFTNRPEKISPESDAEIQKIYNENREKGFISLDRANKNISRALTALQKNDHDSAYQEYKSAVIQLNNTRQFFEAAVEIAKQDTN